MTSLENLLHLLHLLNPALVYIKLHWMRLLFLSLLLLLLLVQRNSLKAAWARWNKPTWLRPPIAIISTISMGTLFIYLLLTYHPYSYKEPGMPDQIPLSPRLQRLFAHTKIVCFGRYAMSVPQEAQVLWGAAGFPAEIKIITGGMSALNAHIAEDIAEIRNDYQRSYEIVFSEKGPVPDSWQIHWFESKSAKDVGLLMIKTYANKGTLSFIYAIEASTGTGQAPRDVERILAQHAALAQSLRLSPPDEVPSTPGFCINQGFIADNHYADQESIQAGIFLPSFPDVSFSIDVNKDAYAHYEPQDFSKARQGLLLDIETQKKNLGLDYPQVTVLRQGKRDVAHWHGEESLVRRSDSVHEFDWELVGKPRDVAYPSIIRAKLYTKVADNRVGAADKATLSDTETVALWDQLLQGLKLRVQTPGAPLGSYYYRLR